MGVCVHVYLEKLGDQDTTTINKGRWDLQGSLGHSGQRSLPLDIERDTYHQGSRGLLSREEARQCPHGQCAHLQTEGKRVTLLVSSVSRVAHVGAVSSEPILPSNVTWNFLRVFRMRACMGIQRWAEKGALESGQRHVDICGVFKEIHSHLAGGMCVGRMSV